MSCVSILNCLLYSSVGSYIRGRSEKLIVTNFDLVLILFLTTHPKRCFVVNIPFYSYELSNASIKADIFKFPKQKICLNIPLYTGELSNSSNEAVIFIQERSPSQEFSMQA